MLNYPRMMALATLLCGVIMFNPTAIEADAQTVTARVVCEAEISPDIAEQVSGMLILMRPQNSPEAYIEAFAETSERSDLNCADKRALAEVQAVSKAWSTDDEIAIPALEALIPITSYSSALLKRHQFVTRLIQHYVAIQNYNALLELIERELEVSDDEYKTDLLEYKVIALTGLSRFEDADIAIQTIDAFETDTSINYHYAKLALYQRQEQGRRFNRAMKEYLGKNLNFTIKARGDQYPDILQSLADSYAAAFKQESDSILVHPKPDYPSKALRNQQN